MSTHSLAKPATQTVPVVVAWNPTTAAAAAAHANCAEQLEPLWEGQEHPLAVPSGLSIFHGWREITRGSPRDLEAEERAAPVRDHAAPSRPPWAGKKRATGPETGGLAGGVSLCEDPPRLLISKQ